MLQTTSHASLMDVVVVAVVAQLGVVVGQVATIAVVLLVEGLVAVDIVVGSSAPLSFSWG